MKKHIFIVFATICFTMILLDIVTDPLMAFSYTSDKYTRPVYTLQEINEGILNEVITFNSIVLQESDYSWYQDRHSREIPKGTVRNETNFVGARKATGINAGVNNVWEGDSIKVEDGETYIVRLYVHNNNPNGLDAVAEGTKVCFFVPEESAKSITVNGWLRASNAVPEQYVDDVVFVSDTAFHLEYVNGSALLENGNYASGDGVVLPDSITNQGSLSDNKDEGWVSIGYDGLDGNVPGCYKYINYITIEVRARFDYEFETETKVRLADEKDQIWEDTIEARVGDKVEFRIEYTNTSNVVEEDVAIRNVLPTNLHYVSDSAKLYNDDYPDGLPLEQEHLIENGIRIGTYAAGANATICFLAEVVDEDLDKGSNILLNWGQTGVGTKYVQDYARVVVLYDQSFWQIIVSLITMIIVCIIIIVILYCKMRKLTRTDHIYISKRKK